MRAFTILYSVLLVIIVSVVAADELPLAATCDRDKCQLPDCRCSGTDIPGGLAPRDTPQFVLVTFDDGVNMMNMERYRNLLFGRRNKNGCLAGATFFVNHEYTSYQHINELYNNGFEIALHSISHRIPQTFWAQADYENMKLEFGDQKIQMSHFANIPLDEIKGVRVPFLQMTGNATFRVMAEVGLEYDSTWGTINTINPGLWPYTLHYASTQECMIPPCPTASIPGPWVKPMIAWHDLDGVPCLMVDSCYNVPSYDDVDGWFSFIVANFERHYKGNRAPFGFYIHEWYLSAYPVVNEALVRFLNMVNEMHDVYTVNAGEVINWVKDPKPLNEYMRKPCRSFPEAPCPVANCGPLSSTHNVWSSYYMAICNACPRVYPWIGNPLGE